MAIAIGVAVGVLTLETLDGVEVALSNYEERRGTVLVFMSSRCPVTIEHVDTALRRAGWDIDPGWVPPLGRVIRIHFMAPPTARGVG